MSEVTNQEILSVLRSLDPYQFEEFVAALWELQDWDTEVTHGSGDMGIDIVATRAFPYQQEAHIQAKRYGEQSRVSGPEMQKYASLKQRRNVDLAIVVTTSKFTQQAVSLSEEFNIKLINGETLIRLIGELGAIELLEDYLESETRPEVPTNRINSVHSGTSAEAETTTDIQPSSTVTEGDYLRLKLVGADNVDGKVGNELVAESIEGLVLAFEIANVSKESWEFRALNKDNDLGLTVYDERGFSYQPSWLPAPFLRNKSLGGGWTWDFTTVRPQSRARIAAYWAISPDIFVTSIEYEEAV